MTSSRPLILLSLMLAMACASEGPSTADFGTDPELQSEVASAKADGIFGSEEIDLGDRVEGSAAGDAIALYAIELQAGDQFTLEASRLSGDLRPAAYLYFGTSTFVAPDSYDASGDLVSLVFTADDSGTHHIVVRAYRGEGTGDFDMHTTCTAGPCAGGSTLTGNARVNQCINRAVDCSFAELPRYNGRVGPSTATRVFEGCLAEEGDDCAAACDSSEEARSACDVIIAELPSFADQPTACVAEMTACLDGCQDVDPFSGTDELENSSATACWSGYFGNCLEFAAGHSSCGGSSYDDGTFDECSAYCEATEGAYDEGPFDSCMADCEGL